MNLKQQLEELNNLLSRSQNVLIFLPENPTYDHLAGGLGLYLGVLKLGKIATIASSTPAKVGEADLVGIDKIKTSLGGKNMVISFPYEEEMIENVSYNLDNNKFNLVIEPKKAPLKFSSDHVEFATGGASADMVFTVGVNNLNHMGGLYHQNKDLFHNSEIANIDNSQGNSQHGRINIVNHQLPTISEIIVLILKNLKVIFDPDIALNLYKGLQRGTNNFHPDSVSALTFEAAALTLRSGAQRKINPAATSAFPGPVSQQNTQNAQNSRQPAGVVGTDQSSIQRPLVQNNQPNQPVSQSDIRQNQPGSDQSQKNEIDQKQAQTQQETVKRDNDDGDKALHLSKQKEQDISNDKNQNGTPSDWLKPKIFNANRSTSKH